METNAVRCTINPDPKWFSKGIKTARRLHGTFDPATKAWLIPASMAGYIGRPENPGLRRVAPATVSRCEHYVQGQGCPLHGEVCR